MVLVDVAFPRSANTFLTHLLIHSMPGLEYFKIPKCFSSQEEMVLFVDNAPPGKVLLLGHNHLDRNWELALRHRKDLHYLVIFRHPLQCIPSFLAMHESKPSSEGRSRFTWLWILGAIKNYYKFFVFAFWPFLAKKTSLFLFEDVVKRPEAVLLRIGKATGLDIQFDQESVTEYLASEFHHPKRTRTKSKTEGYAIHLSRLQKLCITVLCVPLFTFVQKRFLLPPV